MRSLTIGQLAKEAQVNVETVRYYIFPVKWHPPQSIPVRLFSSSPSLS